MALGEEKEYNAQAALGAEAPIDQAAQAAPNGQGGLPEQISQAAVGSEEMDPKMKQQFSSYRTVVSKLMHSKKTRKEIMKILKSGPPEMSVPQATLSVNDQAISIMEKKGIKLPNDVKIMGSVFVVEDLVQVGNMGAGWEDEVDEQETQLIYQDALQDYIHRGLKDGSIDPIELQESAEKLMTPEQKEKGAMLGQQAGVEGQLNPNMVAGNQKGVLSKQSTGKIPGAMGTPQGGPR